MSRPLPRAAVPVLGTLLAVLCGVLVLAPIHRHPSASGDTLPEKLSLLLRAVGLEGGDVSPTRLAVWFGTAIALVMVVLPVLQMVRPDGRGPRTRPGAEAASATAPTGELPVLSRERLRRRARAAGVAWRPAFDTPGGTRALVDLLDRVAPDAGAVPDVPDAPPARLEAPAAELSSPPRDTGADAPAEAAPERPTASDRAVAAPTAPAWSAGSVYTPTDLYGSSRAADPADAAVPTAPEDDEGSTEGRERTP